MMNGMHSQGENLTSSPYSLFGLGTRNTLGTGGLNGMGGAGIARREAFEINLFNPASLAGLSEKVFLFDIGVASEINALSNSLNRENTTNLNFSSLALAFKDSGRSGFGLSLMPETKVGYFLTGVETNVEGSSEVFTSDIFGTGGISQLRLGYAYKFSDRIQVGLYGAYYFGKISEEEAIELDDSALSFVDENFYDGARLGFGLLYDVHEKVRLGATIDSPTTLNATRDRRVDKTLELLPVEVEDETNAAIDDFKLPLQVGLGLNIELKENLSLNLDYRLNKWGSTDQSDDIGVFIHQSIVAIGGEYIPKRTGLKFWERVSYRAGVNYDKGYLEVRDQAIDNLGFTLGFGLPFKRGVSSLNISYTYGDRGSVGNILIQERFHMLTANISLGDRWFVRKKYD